MCTGIVGGKGEEAALASQLVHKGGNNRSKESSHTCVYEQEVLCDIHLGRCSNLFRVFFLGAKPVRGAESTLMVSFFGKKEN